MSNLHLSGPCVQKLSGDARKAHSVGPEARSKAPVGSRGKVLAKFYGNLSVKSLPKVVQHVFFLMTSGPSGPGPTGPVVNSALTPAD